ncbi:MAG: outer membrane beta-barrel family protein [Bacteroidota bacterium]|nr:outer membrane beta-barrel family protein [Bacteroidota bacterium]
MKYLVTVIFVLFTATSFGQTKQTAALSVKGSVKGIIIDSLDKNPLQFANITVHRVKDSGFVTGTSSGITGEFLIPNLQDGSYFIKISFIGYKNLIIPDIIISKDRNEFNAGKINLVKDVMITQENVILGERVNTEFHLDKKVVNVSQNLAAAGGTAVDVLQNQPSIQVDADGNLTLRGNSNFTVMVDGRPSALQGTDALRQIPANIIDKVELITNPSAKYDAEGAAGIINIITKKNEISTTSGIFNTGVGAKDKYNGDFNINYRAPEYSFTFGSDARRGNYSNDITISRLLDNNSAVNTKMNMLNRRDNYGTRFGFDRNVSSDFIYGITGSGGYMEYTTRMNNSNALSGFGENPAELYSLTKELHKIIVRYLNGSFNLTKTFTPKVNDISFDINFTALNMPNNQKTNEHAVYSDNSQKDLIKGLDVGNSRYDSRIKLNYKHKLGEAASFESGLQVNLFYKKTNLTSKNYNFADQVWVIDPASSCNYNFRNNVFAGFATYTDKIIGFDYQAGLRMEYTDRILSQLTTNNDFKYARMHYFPSLSISRGLGNEQQLQFSYSRRIRRPYDQELNPYPFFSDSYSQIVGNPELAPSFTDSYELNYQKSFSAVYFSIQTYLRKTKDEIEQLQVVDNNGKVYLIFNNIINNTAIGSEISAGITAAKWLKIDPAINLYNLNKESMPKYGIESSNLFQWDSRLSVSVILETGTKFQFDINYFPKSIMGQGDIKAFSLINFSVRQEFMEKKLVAVLSAQNLFNQLKYDIYTTGVGFKSNLHMVPEAPFINLSLSYNFNNFKSRNVEQVDVNVNSGF